MAMFQLVKIHGQNELQKFRKTTIQGFVFRIYFYFRLLHIFAIMFWYILHPMNL